MSRLSGITAILLVLALSCGCGPAGKQWKPGRQRRGYNMTERQLAPEPVYNRLRWVHLPYTTPPAEAGSAAGVRYMPVVHLELSNATLQEAASTLASIARYSSFCASPLANRRISINALGTIDELGASIASAENIEVIIDHNAREVRFLQRQLKPAFADNEVSNEHQQNN